MVIENTFKLISQDNNFGQQLIWLDLDLLKLFYENWEILSQTMIGSEVKSAHYRLGHDILWKIVEKLYEIVFSR